MLRPIADIKPFTSYPISNRLVMGEDNQSAPVSSHQILSGRQTPAVTHPLYRVSDFELGEDYPASDNVSSHSVGISSDFTPLGFIRKLEDLSPSNFYSVRLATETV